MKTLRADVAPDRAVLVISRLAVLVRSRSIYCSDHARTLAAADDLLAALRQVPEFPSKGLDIAFAARHATVGALAVPFERPAEQWLGAMLRNAMVGRLAISSAVDSAALLAFASVLCDCAKDRVVIHSRWRDGDGPLRIAELRVRGRHLDGGGPPAESDCGGLPLHERIASSTAIQDGIARLQDALDAKQIGGARGEIDLLPRIIDAVLADVAIDAEQAESNVARILENLVRELPQLGAGDRSSLDTSLARVADDVARRFFGRSPAPRPLDDQSLPSGRREDAAIEDDLPALLTEMDALPWSEQPERVLDERMLLAHVAGIFVHLSAQGRDETIRDTSARRIARIVAGNAALEIPALDRLLAAEPDDRSRLVFRRLLEDAGPELALNRRNLHIGLLADAFPAGFAAWQAKFDPRSRAGPDRIADLLDAVADDRLIDGLRDLMSSRPVAEQIGALLANTSTPRTALAKRLVESDDVQVRSLAIQQIKRLALPGRCSVALGVLPMEGLSTDYLRALCQLHERGGETPELIRECAALLRRFLATTAHRTASLDRRIAAIRALAAFPTPETILLLEELRRGWPFGTAETRAIRGAATETLREIRS